MTIKELEARIRTLEEIVKSQAVEIRTLKDIEEIKPDYIKGLTFHYIEEMAEINQLALLKEKVKDPVLFT